jgi:PAS domain-containing protein
VLDKNTTLKLVPKEAAPAGKIGTWECSFPFELLTWSDEVYDLFEMPRGMRISRSEVLGFYTDESRQTLDTIRTGAIQQQKSFTLDAEINTALGKSRWIRIVAHIEYENGAPRRLYGTKQDITAEKSAR